MWKPMHQRPSIFMRHKRKQPSRYVQEVPSIFLPMPLTEELHRQNKTFGDIEIGHTSMQGWRGHMEDQYIIDEFEGIKDHLIVAIFDGHSGTFAAEYCSVNLKSKIEETEAWQEYIKLDVRARKENVAKISEAMLKGYLQLDESLLALKKDGLMPDDSGCTAVCCVITPTHVVCANVGDSRAVVGSKNQSIALTDDHKPENPEECARIERAGGFVADNRVVGELAMSRAIGDFRYKLNPNLPFHEQLVIPVPDISVHERNRKNDYVLVVACDGVWDAMSNDEAAVFTQQFLEKPQSFSIHDYMDQPMGKKRRLNSSEDDSNDNSSNNNSEDDDEESGSGEDNEALKPTSLNAASALIAVALAKGSMDNISAIVVKFPAARQLEASENN